MRRRDFVKVVGGLAAAWPLAARAQQPGRVRRIAYLVGSSENDPESLERLDALRQALDRLGWKEGVNLRIDMRWGGGNRDRMRAYAKELLAATTDCAVAESTPATLALKAAGPETPIIFLNAGDPVRSGLVASFTRPGGNLTGFTNYVRSMGGKWVELLKEIAPRLTRTAALHNPKTHTGKYWGVLKETAQSVGVTFSKAAVEDETGIARAVKAMAGEPAGGLMVMPDSFTLAHREIIVALTARHRVPAIYPFSVFAEKGGLISYGIDVAAVYRDVAAYVDRVLRGEKPRDLPVQAPTEFELVLNLKTVKALGLTLPPTLLARADKVIE